MICHFCPNRRAAVILLNDKPACRTCQREVLASTRDVKIAPLPPPPRHRLALEVSL